MAILQKVQSLLILAGLLSVTGCGDPSMPEAQISAVSEAHSLALTASCQPKAVYGLIGAKYGCLGGENGFLGCPLTDELSTPNNLGRYNHFAGGSI